MPSPGSHLTLVVEKPVAGGRMLARHQGRVVLVSRAIPGERVRARIERIKKSLIYAETVEVLDASGDRRQKPADPLCGGNLYAHIEYARQCALKAEILADAFARIARLPLGDPVPVVPSPESGYRMRARLHVRGWRIGFFREGTHQICDPAPTGQLLPETVDVVRRIGEILRLEAADNVTAVELAENVPATHRVVQLEARSLPGAAVLGKLGGIDGVTGSMISLIDRHAVSLVGGRPDVVDQLRLPVNGAAGESPPVAMRRHVGAFFQSNRYLLSTLVGRVLFYVDDGEVTDLYAGVGLFAVCLAAAGRPGVIAVEGYRASFEDLEENARPYGSRLRVVHASVEEYLRSGRGTATVIVDPPRTGLSKKAAAGIGALGAERIVYVSCDVATLARDIRALMDAGYALDQLEAFDLFPNTAHVESLAVLTSRTPR